MAFPLQERAGGPLQYQVAPILPKSAPSLAGPPIGAATKAPTVFGNLRPANYPDPNTDYGMLSDGDKMKCENVRTHICTYAPL